METNGSITQKLTANKPIRILLSAFLLPVMLFGGSPAPDLQAASTWTVNSSADTDDGTCDNNCTLREALNSVESGDTINFSRSQIITLRSALPSISGQVTIKGRGTVSTIIQASACNPLFFSGACSPARYRVFVVEPSGDLTLDGVTVRYGNCDSSCGTGTGGGIYNRGKLSLKNSTVGFNKAVGAGGGIDNDAGQLTITNSTISVNTANLGGGLSNSGSLTLNNSTVSANNSTSYAGGISNTGSLTMKNSTILSNGADVDGGGIYTSGTLTVNGGAFYGNRAENYGGGIFGSGGQLKLTNTSISGNSALKGGGGIYNNTTLTVTGSIFHGNRGNNVNNEGGAIRNHGDGNLTITSSMFFSNSAYTGGGIFNLGMLEITDSTFGGNAAYYLGGGISNSSTAYVTNTGFFSNSASSFGGGIWNGSTLYLTKGNFTGNTAPSGPSLTDDGQAYLTDTAMDQ